MNMNGLKTPDQSAPIWKYSHVRVAYNGCCFIPDECINLGTLNPNTIPTSTPLFCRTKGGFILRGEIEDGALTAGTTAFEMPLSVAYKLIEKQEQRCKISFQVVFTCDDDPNSDVLALIQVDGAKLGNLEFSALVNSANQADPRVNIPTEFFGSILIYFSGGPTCISRVNNDETIVAGLLPFAIVSCGKRNCGISSLCRTKQRVSTGCDHWYEFYNLPDGRIAIMSVLIVDGSKRLSIEIVDENMGIAGKAAGCDDNGLIIALESDKILTSCFGSWGEDIVDPSVDLSLGVYGMSNSALGYGMNGLALNNDESWYSVASSTSSFPQQNCISYDGRSIFTVGDGNLVDKGVSMQFWRDGSLVRDYLDVPDVDPTARGVACAVYGDNMAVAFTKDDGKTYLYYTCNCRLTWRKSRVFNVIPDSVEDICLVYGGNGLLYLMIDGKVYRSFNHGCNNRSTGCSWGEELCEADRMAICKYKPTLPYVVTAPAGCYYDYDEGLNTLPITLDVLANDSAAAGCVLLPNTVTIMDDDTDANVGVTVNPLNGEITFTPLSLDVEGLQRVRYSVTDTCGTSCETHADVLFFRVVAVDDEDEILLDGMGNGDGNISVLSNDEISPSCSLEEIEIVSTSPTLTVYMNDDGTFSINLTPCSDGAVSFSYRLITDCGVSNTATVSLTVTCPPIARVSASHTNDTDKGDTSFTFQLKQSDDSTPLTGACDVELTIVDAKTGTEYKATYNYGADPSTDPPVSATANWTTDIQPYIQAGGVVEDAGSIVIFIKDFRDANGTRGSINNGEGLTMFVKALCSPLNSDNEDNHDYVPVQRYAGSDTISLLPLDLLPTIQAGFHGGNNMLVGAVTPAEVDMFWNMIASTYPVPNDTVWSWDHSHELVIIRIVKSNGDVEDPLNISVGNTDAVTQLGNVATALAAYFTPTINVEVTNASNPPTIVQGAGYVPVDRHFEIFYAEEEVIPSLVTYRPPICPAVSFVQVWVTVPEFDY